MPITISEINIERRESLYVRFGGSAELSVFIDYPKDGPPTLRAPFNCKAKTLRLTIAGLSEIPRGVDHAD